MPENNEKIKMPVAFTPVPNGHLELLYKTNLNGREMACVLVVYRKTYGWEAGPGCRKSKAEISYAEFSEETHIDERNIKGVTKGLIENGVLCKEPSPTRNNANVWGINSPEAWNPNIIRGLKVKSRGVEIDTPIGVEIDTSDHLSKEIVTENILNHSGQNDADASVEGAFSGMSVEPFSQNSSNENGSAENVIAAHDIKDVELFSPTRNEHKPGEKKPSKNVPHTIPLTIGDEAIEYQTFSPNFHDEEERLRWNNFVEDHFASLTDSEKEEYLWYVKQDKPFFVKAREHVRIVSWVLFAWGRLLYREQGHNKHFWWKGCADIYNLCEGDLKTLIILADEAADYGKEEGFTLEHPTSYLKYMERGIGTIKTLKQQGLFEWTYQNLITRYQH